MTALEEKIVQRATAAVLNAIYEEEFLGFSYGFRPNRNQHDALDALIVGITSKSVNFILMGWMPPPDGITMCQAGDDELASRRGGIHDRS